MKDIIIYHPHRSHIWFVPFSVGVGILSFIAAGYSLPRIDFFCFCFLAMGIPCFVLSKILYDSSNIAVFLEQDGLQIAERRNKISQRILWEEVSYAYFTRSYKGYSFVVLSPKALNKKQAQDFTNRGANASRVCVDFVLVIYVDATQDALRLKETIRSNVRYIDEYL